MSSSTRLVTRIALFSAIIYVLAWGTSMLPNVNLAFLIAFAAGYLWGAIPGMSVGAIGMWLWTSFNPFGPAALPIAIVQVVGMAACGLIGYLFRPIVNDEPGSRSNRLALLLAAVACTVVFYLPVNLVDAWLFQPFWPRFITGLSFVGISLAANLVMFPLLFGVTEQIRRRERALGW